MKLSAGAPAPLFEGESLTGRRVSLGALRGQTVLVKFYRFASCPVCNLHLREFIRKHESLTLAGITPVVLFHSPIDELERNMGRELPFDIVADPAKTAFRAYGVEASWGGMFSMQVMRDYARAMWAGIVSKPFGHEGGMTGHPADFLIDGAGRIRYAHYGANYADSLTVDQVLDVAMRIPQLASVTSEE